MDRKRIAFVHVTGLSSGGTEQFLQRLAVSLKERGHIVDFYYANNTAEHRKKYVEDHGVRTIKFECGFIVEKRGYRYAFNCNFNKVFTNEYDLVQIGTDGCELSYLSCIKKIPIVDSIHYVTGVNNRYNISRVMHISEFSRKLWEEKGGDAKRTVMISLPLQRKSFEYMDIRKELGLKKDCFIFGMHQANRDEIFSDIPLRAYKEVEAENNAYVLLNGSQLYRKQAKQLGLKRVYFYDYVQDDNHFYSILKSFNVYAHGRKDGELNSAAIAEALSLGLPIITHPSSDFNGHLEIVKNNGYVANDYIEYAEYMKKLQNDSSLREKMGEESLKIFNDKYDFEMQMNNIEKIYEEIIFKPYPHKIRRMLYHVSQKVKNGIIKARILQNRNKYLIKGK